MNTTKLTTHPCPKCKAPLDAAADPSGQGNTPDPGDVTLCFYCETLLEFDNKMKPTEINIKTLAQDVQDAIVVALIQLQKIKAQRTLH